MGFWNKLGKIALVAAPYIAAPFTGGASLAFTGAANSAARKWSEHDAKVAAEKGIAPSKFDKYLGMAGDIASIAGGVGAMSKMGGKSGNFSAANFQGNEGSGLTGWQKALQIGGQYAPMAAGMIAAARSGGGGGGEAPIGGSNSGNYAQPREGRMRGIGPSALMQRNQNSPNLAESLNAGRQNAYANQPFRSGYDIVTPDTTNEDGTVTTGSKVRMPPIYPNYPKASQRRRVGQGYAGY